MYGIPEDQQEKENSSHRKISKGYEQAISKKENPKR